MLETLIKILQMLLSLSIIIGVHEFGHYLAAKIFGVKVEKFYIFFSPGFSIFKKTHNGTEYGIGWLPLGGYVKLDTDDFNAAAAWKRLIITLAGIFMNLLSVYFIIVVIKLYSGTVWFDVIPDAAILFVDISKVYIYEINDMFSTNTNVGDSVGGVISITKLFTPVWDWTRFLAITLALFFSLIFMNILPIPGLDGGNSLLILLEMITGIKPSERFLAYAHVIGLGLILGLVLFANGSDIWKLFN